VKILKRPKDDVQNHLSQQEVFTVEAHPPPFEKYTRSVQGKTKYKIKKYKEGDVVWMWDTQKGEPTNVKGSTQSWLKPFKVAENQLMNPTICPLWKEEGAHYRSAGTSSNPTKVGEPDCACKCR
jgi:hypothetical protein